MAVASARGGGGGGGGRVQGGQLHPAFSLRNRVRDLGDSPTLKCDIWTYRDQMLRGLGEVRRGAQKSHSSLWQRRCWRVEHLGCF